MIAAARVLLFPLAVLATFATGMALHLPLWSTLLCGIVDGALARDIRDRLGDE